MSNGWQTITDEDKQIKNENDAYLGIEAKDLDNYIGELSYDSSQKDFDNAHAKNDKWLKDANILAPNKRRKILNQAAYENRKQLIDNNYADFTDYSNLTGNIDSKWEELDDLQTFDGKYDFSEIGKVLDDYKKIGEGILSYNSTWANKAEYESNRNEIIAWIDQGEYFKSLDVDKDTEGLQLPEEFTGPGTDIYQGLMNSAYVNWSLGNSDVAQQMVNQSSNYLAASMKNDALIKSEIANKEIEYLTENYTKILPEVKIDAIEKYAVQIYQAQQNGTEIPEAPNYLNENDRIIASRIAEQNPDFVNHFNLRKDTIQNQKIDNLEAGAYASINSFRNKMGKGTGKGLMDKIDSELADVLVDIGLYSVAEGKLESADHRNQAMKDIGGNIENIFEYLEGGGWFKKDYYEKGSEVTDLINNEFDEGSPEWIANMDKILNAYLPLDERGIRRRNPNADWVANEFGGGDMWMGANEKEQNGYKILISALESYAALRSIDAALGQDAANPELIDLYE
jgi:hypothetical protein